MRVPPRPVRRVLAPLLLAVLAGAAAILPALLLLAAALSPWLPGRLRALRLLWLAFVYLTLQCVGLVLALALWVAAGFGTRLHTERSQAAHYAVLRELLDVFVRVAAHVMRLDVDTDEVSWSPLDDGTPGSPNAMLVLSRHAGPGDSFLLVHTLMNRDHLRRPRIVLTGRLQLDPMLDVYLNRLPNVFVDAGAPRGHMEARIAALAAGLGEEDALLLFPEGGNFTTGRRRRAIDRLRHLGHHDHVERAEAMPNVLPPRPNGVLAALDAAPHADVVFVAHTGLDHLHGVRDVWRELPDRKRLHLRWSFVPREEVPGDREERIAWLYRWWADIDAWITRRSG